VNIPGASFGAFDRTIAMPIIVSSLLRRRSRERERVEALPHCQIVRLTFTALPAGQPASIAGVKIEGQHWP